MRFFRKNQPWSKFVAKSLLLAILMTAGGISFMDRYRIGVDTQVEKCIPGTTFYLIDRKDQVVEKGKTYAFIAKGLLPFFKDGTQMVKFARGMPMDHVEVTPGHDITINGQTFGNGLFLTRELQEPASKFIGKTVLPENAYWFMGTSDRSFDSRYWGAVKNEQIIGRAYPLL